MRILRELIHSDEPSAVALGFFDGIHLGHRAVLGRAVECRAEDLVPAAFTFTQTPKENFRDMQLLTFDSKIKRLEALGIELLYVIDFDTVRRLTPGEFVEKILYGVFNARKVFCGFNYHFGAGGSGDTEALVRLCGEKDILASVCEPVEVEGILASSSNIRGLLKDGSVKTANSLLGYEFGYSGEVVEGNHLGSAMQTPTINLKIPDGIVLPRLGVYASIVSVDGERCAGVTNIGVKPTVGSSNTPNCETWMPEYKGGLLYGKSAEVKLVDFIRPEKRFDSLSELEKEIKRDGDLALNIIKKYSL